jgi:eukaryotic-like serine/threonine-protein kinase
LKWIAQNGAPAVSLTQEKGKNRELRAWLVAGVLALMLIGSVLLWRISKGTEPTKYFSAPLPFAARDIAVSPNGHTVALVGRRESERLNALWIYEPGTQDATRLANTEGVSFPFWSHDGQSLGLFADGKLKRLNLAGGTVQVLCDAANGRGGAWNKDGVILFTPTGALGVGLHQISAGGGTPVQITVPDKSLIGIGAAVAR